MKGIHTTDPALELPELPRGVTEITICRGGKVHTLHARKPWTEIIDGVGRRQFPDGPFLGGPVTPERPRVEPTRRFKPAPAALPYKDE